MATYKYIKTDENGNELKRVRDWHLIIRDAEIRYQNFAGTGNSMNREGDRNFKVLIDDEELANQLSEDGWYISIKKNSDPAVYQLKVHVSYRYTPPHIVKYKNGKGIEVTEDTVHRLDNLTITRADLDITPAYNKKTPGNEGLTAYLSDGRFTIQPRYLEQYYTDDVPTEEDDVPFDE